MANKTSCNQAGVQMGLSALFSAAFLVAMYLISYSQCKIQVVSVDALVLILIL